MKVVFKGFLRTVAQEVQNGDSRITTGNFPLSFESCDRPFQVL